MASAAGAKRGFSAKAGTTKGLEVWRIEKLDVAEIAEKKQWGRFHTGDCYIVLHTFDNKEGKKAQDVHFWLGSKSSQDEQGVAALKTIEIDNQLKGLPVQHREVEGHESALFGSYFPGGLQYLEGGIESGFRHVDPAAFDPRLFHVKGKRNCRVQQVERKTTSLNAGDVFILDMGLTLYQWNGKDANKFEKVKGLEIVNKIRNDERGGKAQVVYLEQDTKDPAADAFWKALGGAGAIKSAAEAGSDDDVKAAPPVSLHRVSDASGAMKVEKVAEGKLERKSLDANDVFIVDSGTEVFVWVGDKATKAERDKSMLHAGEYLKTNNRPAWAPVTRIIGGGETPAFKALFVQWDPPRTVKFDAKAPPAKEAKADNSALYKKQAAAMEKMVDNASGKTTVWRIKDLKKQEVPAEELGQFYSGDSYIVLYEYKKGTKKAWIIYFWQGRDSSSDEKAASALLTIDLDNSLGGEPVQVRVTQGAEPEHFFALFKGKVVVHNGGFQSGFKNRKEEDIKSAPVALYHIHGNNDNNAHAVQTKTPVASALNSGDCFALNTATGVYVWNGLGANASERKCAANIAKIVGGARKLTSIDEGKEPQEFWDALGGKTEYATSKELAAGNVEPRLFQCTTARAAGFRIDEVVNFNQDDLINDDVMLLDAYSEVFVWVGHDSTKQERDNSFKAALEYVVKVGDGRPADTPVFKVMAGNEPPNFTCHFHAWDEKKAATFDDPYAAALKKQQGGAAAAASAGGSASSSAAVAAAGKDGKDGKDTKSPTNSKFTVALSPQMKANEKKGAPAKAERVTAGDIGFASWEKEGNYTADEIRGNKGVNIDLSNKELYIKDSEFQTIFGMDKAAWNKLPGWKKTDAKKKHRLF